VSGKGINPYVSDELVARTQSPIKFKIPGNFAYGYEATLLVDLCEAILAAREAKVLQKQQEHIAKRAEILVRAFARVGIIALVDEATGFQDVRTRQALEDILNKFIAEELRKWVKTFPDDFYKELFRLHGWRYDPSSVKRPPRFAQLTNDLIYARLAPGVLDALNEKNPKDEKGRRKAKQFQWLTEDEGVQRLREHFAAVIALMRASSKWSNFSRLIERALPKFGTSRWLPLDYKDDEEE
jgi:hypothetical protein